MDLKGISWVGNFYQKFEAMCLEVEETMYQDTIKYVENQVQTVGSSVKKFYSDVMQDLLPPSSVDGGKGADADSPLDFYADIGIYTKPKFGMTEKYIKVDALKKLAEDKKKTTNYNSDYPPNFNRVCLVDNLFPLSQEDSTGGVSPQNGKASLSNKSNLHTRKNSKRENFSLNGKSGTIHPMGKDLKRVSQFYEPSNENHLGDAAVRASKRNVEGNLYNKSNLGTTENSKRENMPQDENHDAFDQTAKSTPPECVEERGLEFIAESKNEIEIVSVQIPDIPTDGPSGYLNESCISKEMDMRASSCGISLAKANAGDICTNDGVISLTESYTNWQVQSSDFASDEDFMSNSGRANDWNTEMNEIDTSVLHEMEIDQRVDKLKLEESCIMVNRDEFHFAHYQEGKSKSYQKRIRDVFSPRKSSMRKHEYEQLAVLPRSDSNLKTLTIKDSKRSPNPDSSEPDWELL